jgi:aryl-alcohol dehydrogenase-like predicted oxidoreductase
MKHRTIGGERVSVIGLGCMGMSEFYGASDREQSIGVIHHALDIGVNFFDTADMYGVGHNEELVGEALRDRRDEAFLATKFGVVRTADGGFGGVDGRPEYVRQQAEASLKRLDVEVIDLYYQHRVDPETPIEDTVGEMSRLVDEGKVRFLGLSEAGPETIRRAHAVHPIAALQTEYSLWTRDPEVEHIALTQELGITFVAYSPLGRGFLSGQIKSIDDLADDDYRRHNERFQGENFQKNLDLVAAVEAMADDKGVTPAQLALAWILAKAPHTVTIPGTRKAHRLDENAAAADLELTDADVARLDEVMPVGATAGLRYPEASMELING